MSSSSSSDNGTWGAYLSKVLTYVKALHVFPELELRGLTIVMQNTAKIIQHLYAKAPQVFSHNPIFQHAPLMLLAGAVDSADDSAAASWLRMWRCPEGRDRSGEFAVGLRRRQCLVHDIIKGPENQHEKQNNVYS